MSRPNPKVIKTQMIGRTHNRIEVYQADAFYVVTYQGRPINVCQYNIYSGAGKKYPKNGSPNIAQTRRLADRLNRIFDTTDFTVTKVL
jgi:hypothetical protein